MWDRVLQLLAVSCRHGHLSQPFPAGTSKPRVSSHTEWDAVTEDSSGHYVVCLECGKHFTYDWSQMRVMK
jgi:hypothetical protein